MNIIFFGTPQFSADVLEYLLHNKIKISAVVTKPDRPVGRSRSVVPVPVKKLLQSIAPEIPLFQPEFVSAPEFLPTLSQFKPDLFVVVAYGEILKNNILNMPTNGCINLHASLLPKLRGAAPIQRAIIEGHFQSGVTIMHLVRKMDAGDIIETATIPITPSMTYGELEKEICKTGSALLLDVIRDIEKGDIKRTPQDHSQATYAAKIELEDCQVNWDLPAQQIHNLIRGVNPEPGAWCWLKVKDESKRLKLYSTEVLSNEMVQPGLLKIQGNEIIVGCQIGALKLLEVQLEGKKRMLASDLFRGLSKDPFQFQNG